LGGGVFFVFDWERRDWIIRKGKGKKEGDPYGGFNRKAALGGGSAVMGSTSLSGLAGRERRKAGNMTSLGKGSSHRGEDQSQKSKYLLQDLTTGPQKKYHASARGTRERSKWEKKVREDLHLRRSQRMCEVY